MRLPRQFPPLGWAAAARLLASGEPGPVAATLASVTGWAPEDQRELWEWCLPRGERKAMLARWQGDHGYQSPLPVAG